MSRPSDPSRPDPLEPVLRRLVMAPAPGSRWQHRSRLLVVTVTGRCVIEATLEPAVAYTEGAENFHWIRPLDQFLDRFVELPEGA